MTDITNFENARIGQEWPICFDVREKIIEDWVYAIFNLAVPIIQLRKKDNNLALFLFKYPESAAFTEGNWWKDSELIWEHKNND